MAKYTPNPVTSGYSLERINTNFTDIATELNDKVAYRDNPIGEPNQMENDLDMNSNDILNAGVIQATSVSVGGQDPIAEAAASAAAAAVSETNAATSETNAATSETNAAASAAAALVSENNASTSETNAAASAAAADVAKIEWQGQWLIGTAYALNDAVEDLNSSYICIQANTGNQPTVGGDAFWDVLAQKGADGAGTVVSVVGGTGVTVDATDPSNPIVNADNNGVVTSITGGTGITVSGTAAVPIVTADNNGTVTSVATSGLATGGPITSTGTVDVPAASQAEAEAGTENTKAMTALRTAESIAALETFVAVQTVNVQDGIVSTGTTVIPEDDTIPLQTEGDEYMTLAITPNDAANLLKVEVVIELASSVAGNFLIAALFRDATANALSASMHNIVNIAERTATLKFTTWVSAASTSATTFKVRAGGSLAGTTTFNGRSSVQRLGGVMASTITITEYTP